MSCRIPPKAKRWILYANSTDFSTRQVAKIEGCTQSWAAKMMRENKGEV